MPQRKKGRRLRALKSMFRQQIHYVGIRSCYSAITRRQCRLADDKEQSHTDNARSVVCSQLLADQLPRNHSVPARCVHSAVESKATDLGVVLYRRLLSSHGLTNRSCRLLIVFYQMHRLTERSAEAASVSVLTFIYSDFDCSAVVHSNNAGILHLCSRLYRCVRPTDVKRHVYT